MLFLTPGSDSFFEFREPRFQWGGSGCQRFLIGFCLSQVGIGDKTELTELKGGPWLTFLSTFFCSKNRLGAQTGEMAAKRGDLMPNMPRNCPIPSQNGQISKLSKMAFL
jgi:hypothetical protein